MDEKTSAEIASIASHFMNHDDPNVRAMAASCLAQTADKGEQQAIPGLPIAGYKPTQSPEAIAVVNRLKALEERVLRELDNLTGPINAGFADQRCIASARTYLQTGFMWAARGIFQPQRVELPEDFKAYGGYGELTIKDAE